MKRLLDAGHMAAVPLTDTTNEQLEQLGGTAAGNATARADAWKRTVAFFRKYLGNPD